MNLVSEFSCIQSNHEFTPTHQKGRRVPINLQPLVNIELKKLLDEKHIIKLNSCSDKNFISPIVITVITDKTVKLALDSKILNKSIHKNKYQMPNIDNLIDTIQQNLNTSASQETAYFSTLDLKYAYSQLNLDPETAKHSNFNFISGEKTGTYRFITGFYGLTDMPAAFQNVMDYTLVGLQNTYCFLDDIIVVSRGSKDDHLKLVYNCLKKLDEDNLRINIPKCHFAKTEIEWLGHKFSQSGIAPLESKTAAIASLPAPKILKQLRSFLGSVHYLAKFIPNLSQLCHPLRPLLKKRSKRDLRGLWETLAPGSTVVRTSNTTTVIKELGVPEVSVRNSDIAKFGTRAERNTDLWEYAKRRPLPYEKTTEEMIAQHTKDLNKKFRGEIKIRHRPNQSDAASGVSSANSNISKAMASRKPRKIQAGGKRSRTTSTTLNAEHLQCLISCCLLCNIIG